MIREWLVNIFQPVEKAADVSVTDFKFETLTGSSEGGVKRTQKQQSSNGHHSTNHCDVAYKSEEKKEMDCEEEEEEISFRVLKRADVKLKAGGKDKEYSVVIKVLPTDDSERHSDRRKFHALLKFSKEVQVYAGVLHSMAVFDEKRYPSACVEPPVPKCFLSQLDAQNDVLVMENLCFAGYRKYEAASHLTDIDHCKVVLRRMAHFHAISTLIQRDSEQKLAELYPFAVEASGFKRAFWRHVAPVRRVLSKYLEVSGKGGNSDKSDKSDQVDEHLEALFWKLVQLRAHPSDRRLSVLIHGRLDLCNIVFQYDEDVGGRPICAKFLDFSSLTVSSPAIDISYFLHRAVHPDVAAANHSALLHHYLRSHTEAIKSFGMHGYEIEPETLLDEYKAKRDYGAMMACAIKPALLVLQRMNAKNAENNHSEEKDSDEEDGVSVLPDEALRLDQQMVPFDLRLHTALASLAQACSCACAVGGSRELALSDLCSDSLEDLRMKKQNQSGLDCSNGGTLKKLIRGLISSKEDEEISRREQ